MSAQVDVLVVLDATILAAEADARMYKLDDAAKAVAVFKATRAAVAALTAERDALREEVERLRWDCGEAYQVVGAGMLVEPCSYTQADVERALDNLSAAATGEPRPHDDLLPWPRATALALTTGESA